MVEIGNDRRDKPGGELLEDSIQNEAPIQQDSQNFSNNVLLSQMISLTSRVSDMETRLVSESSETKRKLLELREIFIDFRMNMSLDWMEERLPADLPGKKEAW